MRKYPILFLFYFLCLQLDAQTNNLIKDGDFSYYDPNDWVTTGEFHYNSCPIVQCGSNNPYAYTSAECGNEDNATGTLSQFITIPLDCTGGILNFSNHTGTSYTGSTVDILSVNFVANGQFTEVIKLSNQNASPDRCSPISIDVSSYLLQHKGETVNLDFISIQSGDGILTVFRIDDVQLNVTSSGGGTSGCVNWINGNAPSDRTITSAADYLCQRGIINSTIDVSTLPVYPLENAAYYTLSSLYNGYAQIPASLPYYYYPSMLTDIGTSNYPNEVNAMCFLEYGDGVSCINRSFYAIHPTVAISLGNILRMLLEAYNIAPDTIGINPFAHNPSTFFCNIYTDDFNYGYFKKAFDIGLLNGYFSVCTFDSNITPGEFFLLMLQRVYTQYQNQHPQLDSTAFYVPNDLKPNNASGTNGTTKAVFESYEKDEFNIPSSGLGLQFNYSYHSDLTEMPLLNQEISIGSVAMESVKQRLNPIGIGWTYSYNIYIQTISDDVGNDAYLAVHWGDGSINMIDVRNGNLKYVTQGAYNTISGGPINGHIENFSIKTKEQITYLFKKDGGILTLQSITDRNNNYLTFTYEPCICGQNAFGNIGAYNRLSRVTDNYGGRFLQFTYYPGTDVLYTVNDNTGRTITFHVERQNLNLSLAINQKNLTTTYLYDGNGSQNLLQSIIKPLGNTITASYLQRKLQTIQTPNYSATIAFGSAYTSSSSTIQTHLQVSPLNGTTYTTSYNYGSLYNLLQSTSTSSNIQIDYTDPNNPTLPTFIKHQHQDLTEYFRYDADGNILLHGVGGQNGHTQEEYFTYDAANDVKTHTLQNTSVINYTYDNNYNLINESGPLGYNKTYSRDAFGRMTAITDGTATSKIGYNGYGNVNSIAIDGTSILQTATYDELSRITDITDANGHTTHYGYDVNDNDTIIIQDVDSLKLTTKYNFNPNDNISSVIDPNGNATTLQYNASDDLEKELTSNNIFRTWTYNTDGTLQQYQNKNGLAFNYTYYPSGDPNEGQLKSDGYRSYEYYPSNNVLDYIRSMDNTTEYQYSYDDFLRIKNQNYSAPNFSSSVGYQYDNSNNVTQIAVGTSGKNFNYSYDALNRISEVKDWNYNLLVTYTYTSSGLLQNEVLGNGVKVNYHYDAAERLDSIWSVKSDGTLLHAIGCSMDNNANHIRESYFVNWTGPTHTFSLFQPPTYQYDANNRMTHANGGGIVTSDNEGNVYSNLQSNFTADQYNFDNNLLSCTVDGKIKQFAYDPAGVRYADDNNVFTLDNLHNSNILGVQQQGSSAYTLLYAHSPYGLVCSIDPNTNAKIYYLYDFRGSTVALVDDNQNLTQYYKYSPFGEVIESSDSLRFATPFLYVGKHGVMYESPHLYYMRARYYDPVAGRFLGADKKWSTNLFVYGNNNPLSNIDPTGKNWIPTFDKNVDYFDNIISLSHIITSRANLGNNLKLYSKFFYGNQYVKILPVSDLTKFAGNFIYVYTTYESTNKLLNYYYNDKRNNDINPSIEFANLAFSTVALVLEEWGIVAKILFYPTPAK